MSDDNLKSVDPVTRLYRAFLLRIPDKGGLTFWINRRRTGTWTLTRIADSFATSNEFKTRYGSLSNLDFVKLIYDNVLERPYDSSGLNYWTRQLDLKRKTRGAVMANFSESNEYKTKQAAEVTVSVLNIFMIGRAPTKAEFDTAVAALDGGQTITAYATQLFASTAYANRVAAPLAIAAPTMSPLYAGVPMQTVLTASGGFGTQTWSATGLPAWATLDAATGTLSGTPTAAGITNVTAKVTAGSGMTGTKVITLDVKAGMPAGCITSDCAQLDTPAGTVQVLPSAVTSVTRNSSGVPTGIALSATAPNIAVGNILVIAPGTNTPSGLIVKVTSFTGANGATRTVAVTKSTLTDAYANGIVQATGTPEPAAPTATRAAASAGCNGDASIDITPEATVGLQPHVTLLWGKNVAGFGGVFIGTGGLKLFQFQLEGDLTFKLKGSMTGSVDCSLTVPGVTVPISLGPAGFLFFKLQPNLGLKASAGIAIDTTVTVHCSTMYAYIDGNDFRSQYCKPTYTAPKVSTSDTGADLTISGGVTASLTFNEAIGISGTLTASAHAGYHPLAHPIGILDGKVTAKLSACLACAFGDAAPTLTIADTTLWEKTFATWDTASPQPTFPLTIATDSLPPGTVGQSYSATLKATGGTKPYTWTATGLPAGLAMNSSSGAISGTPSTSGTPTIRFTATDGHGFDVSSDLPLSVSPDPGAPLTNITDLDAGGFHSCALLTGGTGKCWGANEFGQLGDGTPSVVQNTSVTITGLAGSTQVSTGYKHSCALLTGGTAKCWGYNGNGQLGDGTAIDRATPVAVTGLTGATQVVAGSSHTCALLSGGTVKCWGGNRYGLLGDGTAFDRYNPVVVTGLTGATQLTVGYSHSCALIANGTVKCWGYNGFGELGDGTTTDGYTPVTVTGLSGATQVVAGRGHTCALLTDGTGRCWGRNIAGELGDGTSTPRYTPVAVTGLTGASQLTTGDEHTCALLAGGTAKCWGYNGFGELGDGTTTTRSTPSTVIDLTGATKIVAGYSHTCALQTGGTAKCWGFNTYGQLGDGTVTNRSSPVAVR